MIRKTSKGVIVEVHAQPGAKKTEIQGLYGEPPRLKIRLAAPPVDGAANTELLKFFYELLETRNIELVRGEKSRKKDILVSGVDVDFVRKKLQIYF